jgi:hypothetical protein
LKNDKSLLNDRLPGVIGRPAQNDRHAGAPRFSRVSAPLAKVIPFSNRVFAPIVLRIVLAFKVAVPATRVA